MGVGGVVGCVVGWGLWGGVGLWGCEGGCVGLFEGAWPSGWEGVWVVGWVGWV